jgi:hypothetical protein
VTGPRMSVVPVPDGAELPDGDWARAAVAQADGAIVVHVTGGWEDLPRVAAASWGIEASGAFEQLVLDAAAEPGAESGLAALGVAARIRRVDTSAGLLAALQDALAGSRCVAVVVHSDDHVAVAAALASARAGVSLVRVGRAAPGLGTARAVARLADLHLVYDEDDAAALRQRIAPERIHVVGDPLLDAVRRFAHDAIACAAWRSLRVEPGGYVLAVLNGQASVAGLDALAAREPLVIETPAAWATGGAIAAAGARVVRAPDFIEHLSLLRSARAVVTDSARVRAEAAAVGIRCHALGADARTLGPGSTPSVIRLCDGRAGARVARVLVSNFARVRLA